MEPVCLQYFACVETKKNASPKELFRQKYSIELQITGLFARTVYLEALDWDKLMVRPKAKLCRQKHAYPIPQRT